MFQRPSLSRTPPLWGAAALLLALLLLFTASCAQLERWLFPQQQNATETSSKLGPLSEGSIKGFPQQNSTKPASQNATRTLQTQTCAVSTQHPDKNLQQLQDLLHQQGLQKLLLQALDDPWLQKNLFADADASGGMGKDVQQQAYDCIQVHNERYVNGKKLGELCVQMRGGLVDGCDELVEMVAVQSICLRQKGATMASLKQQARLKALRDILAPEADALQDAGSEELQEAVTQATVLKERYDKSTNTYCMQLRVRYTPMSGTIIASRRAHAASVQKQQKADAKDYTTRTFYLDLAASPVGTPLPQYGDAVAVVQDQQGAKALGLNGVKQEQAQITALVLQEPQQPAQDDATQANATAAAAQPVQKTAQQQASQQPSQAPHKSSQQQKQSSQQQAQQAQQQTSQPSSQQPQQQAQQTPPQSGAQASSQAAAQATSQSSAQSSAQASSQASAQAASQSSSQTSSQSGSQASSQSPSQSPSQTPSQSVQPPHKKPLLHTAATEQGTPPETTPLAGKDIRDFVLTVKISRDFDAPDKGESKVIPLLQLTYYDWIRDMLGLQLKKDKQGRTLLRVHFLGAATNYMPFNKPTAAHTWRIERIDGQGRLSLDGTFLKAGPSTGRSLQQISMPLTWKSRLYEVNILQHVPKKASPAPAQKKQSQSVAPPPGGAGGASAAASSGKSAPSDTEKSAEKAMEQSPTNSTESVLEDPESELDQVSPIP